MTDKTEWEGHTPLPWFAGKIAGDEDKAVSIGPFDVSEKPDKCHYEDTIAEAWDNPNLADDNGVTAQANAALIVHCVNNFPALEAERDALREALMWISEFRGDSRNARIANDCVKVMAEKARQALAISEKSE